MTLRSVLERLWSWAFPPGIELEDSEFGWIIGEKVAQGGVMWEACVRLKGQEIVLTMNGTENGPCEQARQNWAAIKDRMAEIEPVACERAADACRRLAEDGRNEYMRQQRLEKEDFVPAEIRLPSEETIEEWRWYIRLKPSKDSLLGGFEVEMAGWNALEAWEV